MRGTDEDSTARRRGLARLGSSFVAWFAALALIVQLGATAAPRMPANAGEAVAALGALEALLGPHVALCLHEDGSGPAAPAHDPHHCCDDCALCQHGGHAVALVPRGHAVPTRFARPAGRLAVLADAPCAGPRRVAAAQPRAPPIFA
ncbi:MAG: hypothetical protein ABSG83_04695 [Roseiarcus sp.]